MKMLTVKKTARGCQVSVEVKKKVQGKQMSDILTGVEVTEKISTSPQVY